MRKPGSSALRSRGRVPRPARTLQRIARRQSLRLIGLTPPRTGPICLPCMARDTIVHIATFTVRQSGSGSGHRRVTMRQRLIGPTRRTYIGRFHLSWWCLPHRHPCMWSAAPRPLFLRHRDLASGIGAKAALRIIPQRLIALKGGFRFHRKRHRLSNS